MNTTIAQYPVSENVTYAVTRTMWRSCLAKLDVFAAMRAIYTDDYIASKLLEIDQAEALPNDTQRSAAHESIRITLMAQGDVCLDYFQLLKMYLRHAVPKDQFATQYTACGGDLYEQATHNRTALQSMMLQGSEYMEANQTVLMANLNMPATFIEQYREQMELYNTLSTSYTTARQAATSGATAKVEANNKIYEDCISMGMDGQRLFKNSTLFSQFSFEAVSNLISPPGASTAVITVVNATTNKPMFAEVTNTDNNRTVQTEDDGRCAMGGLAAQDTVFEIAADGFAPQSVTLSLKTGTTSRMTVQMVPMFTKKQEVITPITDASLQEVAAIEAQIPQNTRYSE